jgi:hypothetical protein
MGLGQEIQGTNDKRNHPYKEVLTAHAGWFLALCMRQMTTPHAPNENGGAPYAHMLYPY